LYGRIAKKPASHLKKAFRSMRGVVAAAQSAMRTLILQFDPSSVVLTTIGTAD
jgi:hypothetical protein